MTNGVVADPRDNGSAIECSRSISERTDASERADTKFFILSGTVSLNSSSRSYRHGYRSQICVETGRCRWLVSARVREKNTTCESDHPNTWLRPSPQWGNSKYRSPDGSVRRFALWLWRRNYVRAFTLRTRSETIYFMWCFWKNLAARRPAFRGDTAAL